MRAILEVVGLEGAPAPADRHVHHPRPDGRRALDGVPEPGLAPLDALIDAGRAYDATHAGFYDAEVAKGSPDDVAAMFFTSGTTGQPKGVVRDNGGHMVALKWTMKNHYGIEPGETFWAASDIGWAVGQELARPGAVVPIRTILSFSEPGGSRCAITSAAGTPSRHSPRAAVQRPVGARPRPRARTRHRRATRPRPPRAALVGEVWAEVHLARQTSPSTTPGRTGRSSGKAGSAGRAPRRSRARERTPPKLQVVEPAELLDGLGGLMRAVRVKLRVAIATCIAAVAFLFMSVPIGHAMKIGDKEVLGHDSQCRSAGGGAPGGLHQSGAGAVPVPRRRLEQRDVAIRGILRAAGRRPPHGRRRAA